MSSGMIARRPHPSLRSERPLQEIPLSHRVSSSGRTPRRLPRALLACALVLAASAVVATSAPDDPTVPAPTEAIADTEARAASALARMRSHLATGDLPAAEASLADARGSKLLDDYVALFEARLLLARGDAKAAAELARQAQDTHAGRPVATAFAELLGESLLASGDETGARGAWQVAFQSTQNPDRRAQLEAQILASHERTGTLAAALQKPSDETTVADGTALPPEIRDQIASDPSPQELLRRGDSLMERGRSAAAADAYAQALAAGLTGEGARHARLERGHALFRIRRYGEARAEFAKLLPEPEARFWHARALARSGKIPDSIRAFEAIAEAGDERYGAWALYLAGTLLEDRGESSRAMQLYEEVARRDQSDRGRDALWRVGWAAYGQGDHARARKVFLEMAERSEDPLGALRPRYWAARAAAGSGDAATARKEHEALASRYPLSYYGWRSAERLGVRPEIQSARRIRSGSSRVELADVHRVEALLLADLRDFAQEELVPIGARARGLEDRKAVGRLYWLAGDFHRAQRLVVDAYEESLSRGVQGENRVLWQLSWPAAYRSIVREVFRRTRPSTPPSCGRSCARRAATGPGSPRRPARAACCRSCRRPASSSPTGTASPSSTPTTCTRRR